MSSKNSLNQYSEDFLSAKYLPWSMRQFIISYGGVEKLRVDIWGRYWGEEFVKQKEQGKSERSARRLAQEHCQGIVLEMACTAGFLERKLRVEKKEIGKKRKASTPEKNTAVTITNDNQISLSGLQSQIANTTEIQNTASIVPKPNPEKHIVSALALLHGKFSVASMSFRKNGESTAVKFSSPAAIVELFQKVHISNTESCRSIDISLGNVTNMLGFPFLSPSVSHRPHLAHESAYMSSTRLVGIHKEIVEVVYKRGIGTNGKTMVDVAKAKRNETEETDTNEMAVERCKNKDKNERERRKRKDENDSERDKSKDDNESEQDKSKDGNEPERDKTKDDHEPERDKTKDDNEPERDKTINDNFVLERHESKNEHERDENKYENDAERDGSKNEIESRRYGGKDENPTKKSYGKLECVVENEKSIDAEVKESCSVVDEYDIGKVERKKKSFGKRFRSGINRFFHRLCICGEQRPIADA